MCIRDRYFCTYYDAVKAILPAGLWFRQEKIYRIREDAADWREVCRGREPELMLMQMLEEDVYKRQHPDLPALRQLRESGAVVTSEMEAFFSVCPCRIIAVTGSDGKTTTTTLISEILKHAGYTVWLGGRCV